jgi:hypothetical protein
VSWPPTTSTSIDWHFWARDFYTASPVPELDVTVCPFNDQRGTPCSLPQAHGTTNSQGFVSLPFDSQTIGAGGPVSTGFLGYLAISGLTIRPYYYEWDFPITQSDFFSYGLTLTPMGAEQLFAPFNVQLDDTNRGILSVAVYDCLGNLAPGVQILLSTADGMTRSFSPLGRETSVTDEKGLLGFVNVPAGGVTVTATPLSLGKVSSRFTSFVRVGATTSLQMMPTPPGQ